MRLLERRLMNKKGPSGQMGIIEASSRDDDSPKGSSKSIKSAAVREGVSDDETTPEESQLMTTNSAPASSTGNQIDAKQQKASSAKTKRLASATLKRQLNLINSLAAIKLKMFIFVVVPVAAISSLLLSLSPITEASFLTFYFPNMFKARGYDELCEFIHSLDDQINTTKDSFSDRQYFWGQIQLLDDKPIENNYPEDSACSEILPVFRDLAIEYVYIDYHFYITPMELHREYLVQFRDEWYPGKHKSKAALPRVWEQKTLEMELQLKIDYLEKFVNDEELRNKRQKLLDIWRQVRRSLDNSVQCIYLRYAFREIAEDINQKALETNLKYMRKAMTVLKSAYESIAKHKKSDDEIIAQIEEEIKEFERFTIME